MFKTRLDTFGNDFGHFWERFWAFLEFLKFFDFLKNFRRLDPPWNTGQKNFFEKITPKHVQNTFGHFWEQFWAFLEFLKFFDFLKKFFQVSTSYFKSGKLNSYF